MPGITPKTLEEHRAYLGEITRLKLFFMHRWLAEHPDEAPVDVLRKRVDIYRKTDANSGTLNPSETPFDSAAWQALEQPLLRCYLDNRQDAAKFEEEGWAILEPSIEARCERDYLDTSPLANYHCGSLRHNLKCDPPGHIYFHIANAVSPRSIFDDPLYLPACFLVMLEHVEARLGATVIVTRTWLNDNPKWLGLFPRSWHDNLSEPITDVAWHYGFWGQFISARGTFNHKFGDHMRKTGRFFHYPRRSHCGVDEMRRHILGLFR